MTRPRTRDLPALTRRGTTRPRRLVFVILVVIVVIVVIIVVRRRRRRLRRHRYRYRRRLSAAPRGVLAGAGRLSTRVRKGKAKRTFLIIFVFFSS